MCVFAVTAACTAWSCAGVCVLFRCCPCHSFVQQCWQCSWVHAVGEERCCLRFQVPPRVVQVVSRRPHESSATVAQPESAAQSAVVEDNQVNCVASVLTACSKCRAQVGLNPLDCCCDMLRVLCMDGSLCQCSLEGCLIACSCLRCIDSGCICQTCMCTGTMCAADCLTCQLTHSTGQQAYVVCVCACVVTLCCRCSSVCRVCCIALLIALVAFFWQRVLYSSCTSRMCVGSAEILPGPGLLTLCCCSHSCNQSCG